MINIINNFLPSMGILHATTTSDDQTFYKNFLTEIYLLSEDQKKDAYKNFIENIQSLISSFNDFCKDLIKEVLDYGVFFGKDIEILKKALENNTISKNNKQAFFTLIHKDEIDKNDKQTIENYEKTGGDGKKLKEQLDFFSGQREKILKNKDSVFNMVDKLNKIINNHIITPDSSWEDNINRTLKPLCKGEAYQLAHNSNSSTWSDFDSWREKHGYSQIKYGDILSTQNLFSTKALPETISSLLQEQEEEATKLIELSKKIQYMEDLKKYNKIFKTIDTNLDLPSPNKENNFKTNNATKDNAENLKKPDQHLDKPSEDGFFDKMGRKIKKSPEKYLGSAGLLFLGGAGGAYAIKNKAKPQLTDTQRAQGQK